jgi:hypothetical protein
MRRLPGPAHHRLGDGGNSRGSLRIVSGLAENTDSIFCDGSSEPAAANGCPVLHGSRNHQPRGKHAQPKILINPVRALQARPENSCFFLDTGLTWMSGFPEIWPPSGSRQVPISWHVGKGGHEP